MLDAATISSIKSRISKLEAVTTQRGATPSEAQNAAKMAQRLRAKLPPEAPRRQSRQRSQPQDNAMLWEMFRQAMHESPIYVRQHGSDHWDPLEALRQHTAEQSVLEDLDAFLGTKRNGKVRF